MVENEQYFIILPIGYKAKPSRILSYFSYQAVSGQFTLNQTMAQFGCKLSCTPKLWNPRESRLDGKSKEAVEVNAKIDKLLLAINSAYESLVERKTDFDAKAIKDLFQCSADTQMTLLKQLDAIIADIESRIVMELTMWHSVSLTSNLSVSTWTFAWTREVLHLIQSATISPS